MSARSIKAKWKRETGKVVTSQVRVIKRTYEQVEDPRNEGKMISKLIEAEVEVTRRRRVRGDVSLRDWARKAGIVKKNGVWVETDGKPIMKVNQRKAL
jgi:hypothetical protein